MASRPMSLPFAHKLSPRFHALLLATALLPFAACATEKQTLATETNVATKPQTKRKPAPPSRTKDEEEDDEQPQKLAGPPKIHAISAILVDAQTGKVLHAVNAEARRPVASTQKIMTALLVAEAGDLGHIVQVEKVDTFAEPSKLDIEPGETYRRGDLLRILLVKSMNDVARALARDNAGSVEAFAKKMNARAEKLGMTNTHFVNPNGLPAEGQYSTARDMAKLAAAAYRQKAIREIVCLKELRWQHPDGHISEFHNTNRVLSSLKYCNGMKTGYTAAAKFCLVSSASNDTKDVISVVLGDDKPFVWSDSQKLLQWGLDTDSRTANSR